MNGLWKTYGKLVLNTVVLGTLLGAGDLFNRPVAFVTGIAQSVLVQYEWAALYLLLILLLARFVKVGLIHGFLERRSGKAIPTLVSDIVNMLLIIVGIGYIMSSVFNKDMTTLVATGGLSVMIIGIAMRDTVVAIFTGVLINVEQTFKIGDQVRIHYPRNSITGTVLKIGWRSTTLRNWRLGIVQVPNVILSNAVIVNEDLPNTESGRSLEIYIDYDTSVESAERIILAATLAAEGVNFAYPPSVFARKMDRDGVLYLISYTITHYSDGYRADHAVIKSVLQHLRDAGIRVPYAKSEVLQSQNPVRIADRSLDRFNLIKQCRMFHGLTDEACHHLTAVLLERHFWAKEVLVQIGDTRRSLFVIGEGMVKRQRVSEDGSCLVAERFVATEVFGRRSLFTGQLYGATVVAETNVLVYELTYSAMAAVLAKQPDMVQPLAQALALLVWRENPANSANPDASAMARLVHLYRGQIKAIYGADISLTVAHEY